MAASTSNTSRQLGGVLAVAILGRGRERTPGQRLSAEADGDRRSRPSSGRRSSTRSQAAAYPRTRPPRWRPTRSPPRRRPRIRARSRRSSTRRRRRSGTGCTSRSSSPRSSCSPARPSRWARSRASLALAHERRGHPVDGLLEQRGGGADVEPREAAHHRRRTSGPGLSATRPRSRNAPSGSSPSAERPAVEPGEVAGLRRHVADLGEPVAASSSPSSVRLRRDGATSASSHSPPCSNAAIDASTPRWPAW